MSNWCITRINITNNDVNELIKFNDLISLWTSKNYMENSFGTDWLGNIVLGAGIGTVDSNLCSDVECRGMITYCELIDNELLIDIESAWRPPLQMLKLLLSKYLPNATLVYDAEESSQNLYETNNPNLKDLYVIEKWSSNQKLDWIEYDREASMSEVISILQRLLNCPNSESLDKMLSLLSQSEYSESISVNKWLWKPL